MKKVTEKEILNEINQLKEKYGESIKYLLVVYDSDDKNAKEGQVKYTQELQGANAELLMGIFDRIKFMLNTVLDKTVPILSKKKK